MDKLLSIISPCYNGAKYLPQYLDSVLAQTYPEIELILVNDASTDSTLELAESYVRRFKERGYTLVILTQPENKGQAAAINRGLPLFTGEYLMWMDSDDILMPTAAEEKIAFLESHADCDFVINRGMIVQENDPDTAIGFLQRIKPEGKDDYFVDLIYERNIVFGPGSICVRSNKFKEAIPSLSIYESREGQNWQLLLPLAYAGQWGYIDKPLFKYVVHTDSHSHQKRSYEQQITRYDNFEILLNETLARIPPMSDQERKEWKRKIHIKYLFSKLDTSSQFRQKGDYKSFKKELVEQGQKVTITKAYNLYLLKKMLISARAKVSTALKTRLRQ